MPLRLKWRNRLCALIMAACAVAAPGCASWRLPRIDPTGERILIWPGEATPVTPPQIVAPPPGLAPCPPRRSSRRRWSPRRPHRRPASDFPVEICKRRLRIRMPVCPPRRRPWSQFPRRRHRWRHPSSPRPAPQHPSRRRHRLTHKSRSPPRRLPKRVSPWCSRRSSRAAPTARPSRAGRFATKWPVPAPRSTPRPTGLKCQPTPPAGPASRSARQPSAWAKPW